MADETPPEDDPPLPDADEDSGEAGREEVAGSRGGQPGYDLDEAEAYEEADEQEE